MTADTEAARVADLHSLAARAEAADPSEQREVLIAAWEHLFPARYSRMIVAEAYESAAMMLVPEGWQVAALEQNWRTGLWRAQLIPVPSATLIAAFDRGETVGWNTADAPDSGTGGIVTPALALVAACLRARATQGENDAHR
jgi:hypothetical protein